MEAEADNAGADVGAAGAVTAAAVAAEVADRAVEAKVAAVVRSSWMNLLPQRQSKRPYYCRSGSEILHVQKNYPG